MSKPDRDGIDISHWNRITDWEAVEPFKLWCMKATEGKGFRSPVFDERWPKVRERDEVLYSGAYHWIRSDSSMEAQVANLERAINDHGGLHVGEFVMLDWETTPGIANVTVAEVEEWLARVEAIWPGRCIVYSSDWVSGFKTWRRNNPDYPLWYANYRLVDDYRGGKAESDEYGAEVWQWTSTEAVNGFAAGIDVNDVLGDEGWATLHRISGYDQAPAPAPEPEVPAAWPPYTPPSSYSLWPLAKDKDVLRQTPPRTKQDPYHVTYLQDVLKHEASQRVTVDGWFGPQTEHAVRRVQKFFGLHVDGIVGNKQTWPVIDYLATD